MGVAGAAGPATSAPANEPPVAAFLQPAPVRVGEVASLDASASIDPEGGPLTFRWSFGDGGLGDGVRTSHPFAAAGVYQVVLVATDSSGATGTASASIEVAAGARANELAAIDIEGGARFAARPEVSVEVRGPPGAVQAQLANAPDFAGAVAVPLGPHLPWRLEATAPDGPRQVFVRFFDAAGYHLPGFDRVDRVDLDRAPPVLGRARAAQSEPVLVCAPGGPAVAGTSRRRVPVAVRVAARDEVSGVQTLQARSSLSPPKAAKDPPWSLISRPGGTVDVRAIDRVGNASRWRSLRVPAATIEVLNSADRPFTRATACPSTGQALHIGRVNSLWRATGAPGGDRSWIRPAGSHLTWTVYSGQGLFPNWVHAGTELNARLHDGSAASYREAVSEVVAMSTLDRAGGRAFRVNENLFAVPEDGHPPPWRDAMGTGLILALIPPALSPAADAHEVDAARRLAGQYLSTFFVDHRRGGVVFDIGGGGAWYLEYTYRSRDRVLNGFLQSVLSLSRFARQANRLSRRHPEWAALGDRARERVRAGALAAYRWLPAYDLGGGASLYQLGGSVASPRYRAYHQLLLEELAQIPYLPIEWRDRFELYRVRWGGAPRGRRGGLSSALVVRRPREPRPPRQSGLPPIAHTATR
jgi:PKD repeat protein